MNQRRKFFSWMSFERDGSKAALRKSSIPRVPEWRLLSVVVQRSSSLGEEL